MSSPDYHALAASSRCQADATTLDNVRDRWLRSEAAFLAMARRQDRIDESRIQRAAV
jgi:hypothetical protein